MPEKCPNAHKQCPLFYRKLGCHLVNHHIFWPAQSYAQAGETAEWFRELPQNKVRMCKQEEVELHQRPPPPVPSMAVMEYCVEINELKEELEI